MCNVDVVNLIIDSQKIHSYQKPYTDYNQLHRLTA